MERKTRRILAGFLLMLAMVIGLMPGMGGTAYAANATWSESFTSEGGTINGNVTVSANITLTIPEGKTLTVNGSINGDKTLTVEGAGTLVVTASSGNGITGNLVVKGATVRATGGKAVKTVVVAKGKTSVTIKGLKANKTYYVRMRPMRKASGNTFSGLVSGYRTAKAAK
ncbi:MAG: hypothetical protein IKG22_07560 [Atopobiaceae bacterium]|nr:hypothetical protein [Atopobiaceae bacterium]